MLVFAIGVGVGLALGLCIGAMNSGAVRRIEGHLASIAQSHAKVASPPGQIFTPGVTAVPASGAKL